MNVGLVEGFCYLESAWVKPPVILNVSQDTYCFGARLVWCLVRCSIVSSLSLSLWVVCCTVENKLGSPSHFALLFKPPSITAVSLVESFFSLNV